MLTIRNLYMDPPVHVKCTSVARGFNWADRLTNVVLLSLLGLQTFIRKAPMVMQITSGSPL
jgi:hypothetical protein